MFRYLVKCSIIGFLGILGMTINGASFFDALTVGFLFSVLAVSGPFGLQLAQISGLFLILAAIVEYLSLGSYIKLLFGL